MAFSTTTPRFSKILFIVLALAFGLVMVAMMYQAVLTNTETRSKAAVEETIFKQWEFNGSDSEGWTLEQFKWRVQNGLLSAVSEPGRGNEMTYVWGREGLSLPVGNKYVKLRIAVIPPPELPRNLAQDIHVYINYYTSRNGQPLTGGVRIQPGEGMREYVFKFPEIGKIVLSKLSLSPSLQMKGVRVKADWIRITGPVGSRGGVVTPPSSQPTSVPSTPPASGSGYTCPPNGWINCMPGPGMPTAQCSQAAIAWAQQNCPGFQGVAY